MNPEIRIESLLSARLLLNPQLCGKNIFFISDLSGRLSLYSMKRGGSLPQSLLPPHIALQNPTLIGGKSFHVFPAIGKILVMLDKDGDENYHPYFIPLDGGIPRPVFEKEFADSRVYCMSCDIERNIAYFLAESWKKPEYGSYRAHLEVGEPDFLGKSPYGNWVAGRNEEHTKALTVDSYSAGDNLLYEWDPETESRRLLYGKPLEKRAKGEKVPLNSIGGCHFVPGDRGIIFFTSIFSDSYGLGYMNLDDPQNPVPVEMTGTAHEGQGTFEGLEHLRKNEYLLFFNIDGCSFVYRAELDVEARLMQVSETLCGTGALSGGVLQDLHYEKASGDFVLSFSTATSPSQIFTIEGEGKGVTQHSRERILGIPEDYLSPGEDASFVSHDGLRVSAKLYLPSGKLGLKPNYPVIFYIHGGPQSQERPDFTWFSMPLIQFFTLNGFAVFVPNVRGSSGYGLDFMKRVDRDWGGQDRLDHVHAHELLRKDDRLDMNRAGVMGRSYGGYMTLTLAGRHPMLWKAACDMFGPYNLLTFVDRIPEAWKTFFHISVGHPEKDRDFYIERSPSTHLHQLACPMLVIQGKNDPRVKEIESRDVVEQLRAKGKDIEYLVFENEGHDVIKFENKVKCYNEIVKFFSKHLK